MKALRATNRTKRVHTIDEAERENQNNFISSFKTSVLLSLSF